MRGWLPLRAKKQQVDQTVIGLCSRMEVEKGEEVKTSACGTPVNKPPPIGPAPAQGPALVWRNTARSQSAGGQCSLMKHTRPIAVLAVSLVDDFLSFLSYHDVYDHTDTRTFCPVLFSIGCALSDEAILTLPEQTPYARYLAVLQLWPRGFL